MKNKIAVIGCLLILFGCNNKPEKPVVVPNTILENVIKTTCRLEWRDKVTHQAIGGGSGTCIYHSYDGHNINAYFITAAHVINAPLSPYFTRRLEEVELIAILWRYSHPTGRVVDKIEYNASILWKCVDIDAALICITAPDIKIKSAKLAHQATHDKLRIGDVVIRSGCPTMLPPLIVRGHIARFNVYIKERDKKYDIFLLHTYGGDSGSGIFLEKTYEIIGITCIGHGSVPYFCGVMPSNLIVAKLLETPYKFTVTTE